MATKSLCTVDGCGKPAHTRGWCKNHYGRWYRNGSPTGGLRLTAGYGTCSVNGCDRVGKLIRGWCSKHYQRWQDNGDPLISKIDRDSSGGQCRSPECREVIFAKGLCSKHYNEYRGMLRYADGAERRHAKHGAINKLSLEDAAYIAGLIDADGTVTVTQAKSQRVATPMVLIVNGDYPLIQWLKETIGAGCSYMTKTKPTRPDQNKDNWNPVHRYQITGWKALSLLKATIPFMRVKGDRADLVDKLVVKGRDFSQVASEDQVANSAEIYTEIRRLNRRGLKQAA